MNIPLRDRSFLPRMQVPSKGWNLPPGPWIKRNCRYMMSRGDLITGMEPMKWKSSGIRSQAPPSYLSFIPLLKHVKGRLFRVMNKISCILIQLHFDGDKCAVTSLPLMWFTYLFKLMVIPSFLTHNGLELVLKIVSMRIQQEFDLQSTIQMKYSPQCLVTISNEERIYGKIIPLALNAREIQCR
jgi:hypothetical protein